MTSGAKGALARMAFTMPPDVFAKASAQSEKGTDRQTIARIGA
jgi:hypothetical protein